MEEKEHVTITEAADILRVSRSTIYRLIAEKQLHPAPTPFYKRGGPQRIPRSEVEALLRRE